MRYVLLAVVLAAVGCRPARGTDDGAQVPRIVGFYRDARRPARTVVVGHGKPAAYAGPTTAGPPEAKRRQAKRQQNHATVRGTCTAVTIRLPGVMVYHGDLARISHHGDVARTVTAEEDWADARSRRGGGLKPGDEAARTYGPRFPADTAAAGDVVRYPGWAL